jgi:predicted nucleic acid-binding protein
VDSSVPLAVLRGQTHAPAAAALWDGHPRRVSSSLLELESRTVLRRAERASGPSGPRGWLGERERMLSSWLDSVALRIVDRAVTNRLAAEPLHGTGRTLDAVHLATALLLRDHLGPDLVVCTFDGGMAAAARALGFVVRGAPEPPPAGG